MENLQNHEQVTRQSYTDSVSYILAYSKQEQQTQAEVLEWLENSQEVTKKESPEQHLGVVAFITNPAQTKVFLINHKKAGSYLMAGGHVDKGQNFQVTLQKELKEELGLDIDCKEKQPFYVAKILTQGKNAGHNDITVAFRIVVPEDTIFQLEQKEADSARWFDWAELDSLPQFTQLSQIKEKLEVNKIVLVDNGGVLSDHYCEPWYGDLANILEISKERLGELLSERSAHGIAYRKNLTTRNEFWDTVIKLSGTTKTLGYSVLEKLWAESYQLNQSVVNTLKQYQNVGIKTGNLMNTDRYRKEYIEQNYSPETFLDHTITSCDTGFMKPDPEIFEEVMKVSQVKPENILYADDRKSHADKSSEIGMTGITYATLEEFKNRVIKFYQQ